MKAKIWWCDRSRRYRWSVPWDDALGLGGATHGAAVTKSGAYRAIRRRVEIMDAERAFQMEENIQRRKKTNARI